jgi:hypothetical protein
MKMFLGNVVHLSKKKKSTQQFIRFEFCVSQNVIPVVANDKQWLTVALSEP